MSMKIDCLDILEDSLIETDEQQQRTREGRRDQKMLDGLQAQVEVAGFGAANWQVLREWIRQSNFKISHGEDRVLESAARVNLKPLSEAQSIKAKAILERAKGAGFAVATV